MKQFQLVSPQTLTLDVDPSGKVVRDGSGSGKTSTSIIGIGAMAGFDMACDVVRSNSRGEWKEFEAGDRAIIECTGSRKNNKAGMSDMVEFRVYIERD